MLEVENLGGWLTTVLARVCLDMLRQRKARREESLDHDAPEPVMAIAGIDPDQEMAMADAVGLAMMVVLEKQGPAERIAYVLHDMFDISFDDIGTIVQRTPVSARQLASRTRRRVSVLWRICVAQNRLPRPSGPRPQRQSRTHQLCRRCPGRAEGQTAGRIGNHCRTEADRRHRSHRRSATARNARYGGARIKLRNQSSALSGVTFAFV